jgi:hypothetical protein
MKLFPLGGGGWAVEINKWTQKWVLPIFKEGNSGTLTAFQIHLRKLL